MDQEVLRNLAEEFLRPLFSGATLLQDAETSNARENRVAFSDPCTISFKIESADNYRLRMRRCQPFASLSGAKVTEHAVVRAFVQVVASIQDGLQSSYGSDLRKTFSRRVIANAVAESNAESFVLAVIDQLTQWAGQQYEGKPLSATVGLTPGGGVSAVLFEDVCREPLSAVLSNGFDTLISCTDSGCIVGHESLDVPESAPPFAPLRYAPVAQWADQGRLVLALNRAGEILVFRDRELCFARRNGQWHFLTHEPVLKQMCGPDSEDVRRAVYASCLDASFARTGACISIVTSAHRRAWRQAVSSADYLSPATTTKTKMLATLICGRAFQDLDRRLRQELLAIDGATLIDHNGAILTVGAIVKVPGGSAGGGRLAAAMELSRFGIGIKVSQDGGIRGFKHKDKRFQVM